MTKVSFLTITIFMLSKSLSIAAIVVMNGLTHIHSIQPGASVQGKIIVKNQGTTSKRVVIYKNDLLTNCDGSFTYSEPGENQSSLCPYLETNVDERVLAPNEEYIVFYDINLTTSTISEGSFWGLLMIEGADPVKEEESNNISVNSKVRYAVQIIADIGGFRSPEIIYDQVSFKDTNQPDGSKLKTLDIVLKNMGVFASRVKLIMELYDEQGNHVTTLEGQQRRVYPANCTEFFFPLSGLDPHSYNGVLVADNGEDLFGANVSFEVE